LIQGQPSRRNIDSKERPLRFVCFKIEFHRAFSATFATQSAKCRHRANKSPGGVKPGPDAVLPAEPERAVERWRQVDARRIANRCQIPVRFLSRGTTRLAQSDFLLQWYGATDKYKATTYITLAKVASLIGAAINDGLAMVEVPEHLLFVRNDGLVAIAKIENGSITTIESDKTAAPNWTHVVTVGLNVMFVRNDGLSAVARPVEANAFPGGWMA